MNHIQALVLAIVTGLIVALGASPVFGMAVNRQYAQTGLTQTMPCSSGLAAGSPIVVGKIPGVLLTTASTTSPYNATVQLDGVFQLSVDAVSTDIAYGTRLYWNSGGTPQLTNDSNSGAYPFFGTALEAIATAAGTVVINVQVGKYSV